MVSTYLVLFTTHRAFFPGIPTDANKLFSHSIGRILGRSVIWAGQLASKE